MKSQRRPIVSILLALAPLLSLFAQADCAGNLACIGEVNLTLSGTAGGRLLPSMVLTGDSACIAALEWRIVVEDDSTQNGAFIDSCGRFRYTIEPADPTLTDFPGCWGFVNAEDKTSPRIVDSIAGPAELFCSELDDIVLSELPATVSR